MSLITLKSLVLSAYDRIVQLSGLDMSFRNLMKSIGSRVLQYLGEIHVHVTRM